MNNLTIELRPQSLDQVVGQDHIVTALKSHLAKGDRSVGYLFSGETGVGKTTISEILAKELGPADIERYNAADKNGVDFVRGLIEKTAYSSLSGLRIYLLNEVHKLTDAAQNCLLDPLEDKDSHTVWILTTTSPNDLLGSLRDRCLWFKLQGITGSARIDLVAKALAVTGTTRSHEDILKLITEHDLTSGRDILNAVELYSNGMPLAEIIISSQTDPQYQDIAKSVVAGNWKSVAPKLLKLKPQDAKGLRQVVSAWLRNYISSAPLTNFSDCDRIADTLQKLALYTSFEAGVDLGALVGMIYNHCKKQSGK